MATPIEDLYEEHIRPLSPAEQLRLVELIAREMARVGEAGTPEPRSLPRSLMELHGLGAEIWGGVDAQWYVDHLRGEWGTTAISEADRSRRHEWSQPHQKS